jgi:hypothetical protein
VGFNPFRKHDKSAVDILVMVLAGAAAIAAIVWAILPT